MDIGMEHGEGGRTAAECAQLVPWLLCLPFPRSDYHRGVFCFGDTKGNVIVFTSDNVANGLFNPRILPRTSKWGS